MNSMTGFGSHRYRRGGVEIDVHVKSVNGRFLELRLHLPKEFAPFEVELRRELKGWDRGTVDVFVHRRARHDNAQPTLRINRRHAAHWTKELRSLNRALDFGPEVTLADVLRMPQVLESVEATVDAGSEMKMVVEATRRAVTACAKVRRAEGARLERELLGQLAALEKVVKSLGREETSTRRSTASRLGARVASLGGGGTLDPERLAIETALILEKVDVREELVRLDEHILACRAAIRAKGARGKKLDFYGQELLREVNTIGSKSPGVDLTHLVVDAKSVIEKFREQVQNIE